MSEHNNPEREVQHAEFTVIVAKVVDTDTNDDERLADLWSSVKEAIDNQEGLEFRRRADQELTIVESMEERNLRKEAEAEAAHEAKLERQFARHVDRHGWF